MAESEEMSVWVCSISSWERWAVITEAIGAMAENMVAGIMAMADLSTQRRPRGEPHGKRSVRNAALPTLPLLVSVSNAQHPLLARAARVAALTCLHRPNSVTNVAALRVPSPAEHAAGLHLG